MPVIGGRELGFRVNVRPTNSDVAPENYGPIHDLSAMPQARWRRGGPAESHFRILQNEIESYRGPCRRHG